MGDSTESPNPPAQTFDEAIAITSFGVHSFHANIWDRDCLNFAVRSASKIFQNAKGFCLSAIEHTPIILNPRLVHLLYYRYPHKKKKCLLPLNIKSHLYQAAKRHILQVTHLLPGRLPQPTRPSPQAAARRRWRARAMGRSLTGEARAQGAQVCTAMLRFQKGPQWKQLGESQHLIRQHLMGRSL